jgi:hypothetical protein
MSVCGLPRRSLGEEGSVANYCSTLSAPVCEGLGPIDIYRTQIYTDQHRFDFIILFFFNL